MVNYGTIRLVDQYIILELIVIVEINTHFLNQNSLHVWSKRDLLQLLLFIYLFIRILY